MFLKKANQVEFETELSNYLNPEFINNQKKAEAFNKLLQAANQLDQQGLSAKADLITHLLERLAWMVPTSDPATNSLTSEKMESNLLEKGWIFNNEDGQIIDVADPSEDLNTKDELIVEDIDAASDKKDEVIEDVTIEE
jgi:hypothetical protein